MHSDDPLFILSSVLVLYTRFWFLNIMSNLSEIPLRNAQVCTGCVFSKIIQCPLIKNYFKSLCVANIYVRALIDSVNFLYVSFH